MNKESGLNSANLEFYLDFACRLAKDNGAIMRAREVNPSLNPEEKVHYEWKVVDAIEESIQSKVSTTFPTHTLFRRGDTFGKKEGYEWICDCIDGAFSYAQGHRISVSSVALTLGGASLVSAVYNPWTDQLFYATLEGGAYLNKKRLQINQQALGNEVFLNCEWWPTAQYDVDTWMHGISKQYTSYVLHLGSVIHSACLVASGVFAASVFGGYVKGKNHEVAAVKLIIEEAGGSFTDLFGDPLQITGDIRGFIIGSKTINQQLVHEFKTYHDESHSA